MAVLKSISGHSKKLAQCKDYLLLGRGEVREYFEGKGGDRCIGKDFVNMPLPYMQERWDEVMDETRAAYRNDRDWGSKKAVTYRHFIISPNPEDRVELGELRKLAREWVELEFGTDGKHGMYQAAIFYHDDNSERLEKGLPGIPHAHIVVNNTNLANGRRMHFDFDQVRGLAEDLEILCMEMGLSYFTVDKVEDVENNKVMFERTLHLGLSPEERSKIAVEREAERLYGQSVETPSEIAGGMPRKTRRRDMRPSAQDEFRTMGERIASGKGHEVWKDTLRQCITIACNVSGNLDELKENLAKMGIVATTGANKHKRDTELLFYYPNPGVPFEENKRRVYGGRLGKRFTNKGLEDQMRLSYYRHLAADDRNDLRVIDLVSSITTFRVTDGRTLTNIELHDVSRAFNAIDTFSIQNLEEATSLLERWTRAVAEPQTDPDRAAIVAKMRENLESLVRVAEYTDLLPESSRTQRTPPKDIDRRRAEAKAKRSRADVPLSKKIQNGMRLTKEEYVELKQKNPGEFRRWQRNRNLASQGRPTSSGGGRPDSGSAAASTGAGRSKSTAARSKGRS